MVGAGTDLEIVQFDGELFQCNTHVPGYLSVKVPGRSRLMTRLRGGRVLSGKADLQSNCFPLMKLTKEN